jgi:hypothetical protein
MTLGNDDRRPQSFGDYLCLGEAAMSIGARLIDGWCDFDLAELDSEAETEGKERALRVGSILLTLLIGGQLSAFGTDDEGAYTRLERNRLSKPYFDIDIARSLFRWAPDDWAVIYVSKVGLRHFLDGISATKPRKTIKFDGREVASVAWRLALDDPGIRTQSKLIGAVQDFFVGKYDQQPDAKELRPLTIEIIDHLGDRILSRGDSEPETPCESGRESE